MLTARPPVYPVSLVIAGQPCLVVGGGRVAVRKIEGLARADTRITVVAPRVDPVVERIASAGGARIEHRPYRRGEAAGYRLVLTATGVPEVDAAVAADANAAAVWVNSADDPAHCTVLLPAIHRDGPVTVAVSTAGASPALSAWLRLRIAEMLGERIGELAEVLADARRAVQESGRSTESIDWKALLGGPFPELVQAGRLDDARRLLDRAVAGHRVGDEDLPAAEHTCERSGRRWSCSSVRDDSPELHRAPPVIPSI
jgi:siroheme synthase-like protein